MSRILPLLLLLSTLALADDREIAEWVIRWGRPGDRKAAPPPSKT